MTAPRDTPDVRRATTDDVPILAELFDLYRVFYNQPSDIDAARAFLLDRLTNDESAAFIAFADGEPAGFVHLYPTFSSVSMMRAWILNDLFVLPEHRRRGIANALMQTAEDFARANPRGVPAGTKDIELKTAADNTPAQALYEARGWQRITQFVSYKKDLR